MPTFCRHNRFIERCPICRRTLPGVSSTGSRSGTASGQGARRSSGDTASGAGLSGAGSRTASRGSSSNSNSNSSATGHAQRRLRASGREVRVRREARSEDDGYSCELVPGLRSSADAARLAEEIAFASGRLARMHAAPPDLFGEIRAMASDGQLERATWVCFLTVYLSPLQGDDPFAGVRTVLERERMLVGGHGHGHGHGRDGGGPGAGDHDGAGPKVGQAAGEQAAGEQVAGERGAGEQGVGEQVAGERGTGERGMGEQVTAVVEERDWSSPLDGVPLGPRTSHDPARGSETLRAYRQWVLNADRSKIGPQERAFVGDEAWTPTRRFERAFERLALPGLGRMGRYELLVTLGRLGLYEMQAGSLHLAAGRGMAAEDLTTVAAKRILAVGEPIYLERRAQAFAQELSVPIDVLDLAFANWGASERATLGFKEDVLDHHTLNHVREVLEL